MRRVVVTGMGIWSCIGQDLQTVTESLRQGRSGIIFDPKRIEYGLQSGLVGNVPRPDLKPLLPRKFRATMSEDAEYAYMAVRQALEHAKINKDYLTLNEVGLIGNSTPNYEKKVKAAQYMQEEGEAFLLGPSALFQIESSSCTMNLATIFNIRGVNLSIDAGCSSGSIALGMAAMYIRMGLQKVIVVEGARMIDNLLDNIPDKSGEILSRGNNNPQKASRPMDNQADGRVSSGGAAALVLEEYEHAVARGVEILAEVSGFEMQNNGEVDILLHEGDDCMSQTIERVLGKAQLSDKEIDYVNASVPSIKESDIYFANELTKILANGTTKIGATTSITGYESEMSGISEVVYSILMMSNNFIAPTLNVENIIPQAKDLCVIKSRNDAQIDKILNVTTGTGGICCAVILKKCDI